LYHKENDLTEIPGYLNALGLGYKFFLDHFTIHNEETVLFARVDRVVSHDGKAASLSGAR
jgi:hypothetical protein